VVVQGECEDIIHVAHVSCFKHASQLGDVVDGHLKCFKHHLWKNHLLKASHVKKSIILIFPLCLVLLCSTSSLLFNHHSSLGELFIIHFLVDMHQGNSFVEPLFALAHFLVLWYSTRVFLSCVFTCLIVIPLAFEHFVSQLAYVGLLIQPHSCTSWLPSSLPFNFPPLVDFCCPSDGITVLGIMFGSISFISYSTHYMKMFVI